MLTAEELLEGPRGRGLCIAVAEQLYGEDWPAWYADNLGGLDIVIEAINDVDATPVSHWRDPMSFADPVEVSVSSAMYWQQPDECDVVAADPGVVAALYPIAEAVADAPASAWWDTPVDLSALRYTSRFDEDENPSLPALTGGRERLDQWHSDAVTHERRTAWTRRGSPAAPITGRWWSVPTPTGLVTTTRPLPGLGSIKLIWEEDSFDQDRAQVWPMTATCTPRVWEIDRPQAWVRLVDEYPLKVTNSRRHDWYHVTGRVGTWRMPDWAAVAADWDAVHLSVAGYLTTATRALPLADGDAATVLAGCDPDQTWWLNDVLTTNADPELWHRADDSDVPVLAWSRST